MTYRVIPFASPQSEIWHPFTGEHYINRDDKSDQVMVTFYPRGSRENAGPHLIMTRLEEYVVNITMKFDRWETLSVTPLPGDAGRPAIRALFAAFRSIWQATEGAEDLDDMAARARARIGR